MIKLGLNFLLYSLSVVLVYVQTMIDVDLLVYRSFIIFYISFLLLYIYYFKDQGIKFISKINLKRLLSYFLSLIIVCLVNTIAVKKFIKWDITDSKVNGVSGETKSLLQETSKLEFTIIAKGENLSKIQNLIRFYGEYKRDISINLLDPDIDYSKIRSLNISRLPALMVKLGEHQKVLYENFSEALVSNTIFTLKSYGDLRLCYLEQSSMNLENTGENGGQFFKTYFSSLGFKFFKKSLEGEIDQNCSLYILWGQKTDFTPEQLLRLEEILNLKKLLIALDPSLNGADESLVKLFLKKNIKFSENVVLDAQLSKEVGDSSILIFNKSPDRDQRVIAAFSRSVKTSDESEGFLLSSEYPKSWGETNLEGLVSNNIEFNEGVDEKGPLALGVLSGDVLAFGSTEYLRNKSQKYIGNFDFISQKISSLLEIRSAHLFSKNLEREPFDLNNNLIKVFFIFCFLIIPGFLFFLYSVVVRKS